MTNETVEPQLPNEEVLRRVAADNIRDNQIGGRTDGITEETARDLGFSGFSGPEVAEISRTAPVITPEAEPTPAAAKSPRGLTSAEQNANARRAEIAHNKRAGRWRQRRGR